MASIQERHSGKNRMDCARAAGMNKSTFNDFIDGKRPRLNHENLMKLCGWLGFPPERFSLSGGKGERSIDAIERDIKADPSLTPDAAHKLSSMMRGAYEVMTTRGDLED
jgi:hypothetical protein